MRKIYLTLVGLFFSLLLALPVQAAEVVYSDGFFQYHVYEGYNSICGYFGKETTVTVPSSIAGRPVSRIEEGAFDGCNTIKKLVLPDTIMEIEDNAFSGAQNLETIEDASGVWDRKKAENEDNGNSNENSNGSGSGNAGTSNGNSAGGSGDSGVGEYEYTENQDIAKLEAKKTEAEKKDNGKSDVSVVDSDQENDGIETEIIKDSDSKTESQSKKGNLGLIVGIIFAVAVLAGGVAIVIVCKKRTEACKRKTNKKKSE